MPRPGRKRLTVDMPISFHEELKLIAFNHRCTLTKLVVRYLVEKVLEEKKRNEPYENLCDTDNSLPDLGHR